MTQVTYTAYLKGSLKLSAQGIWFHNGTPFSNPNVIKLFNRSIVWDAVANSYFVQISTQRASFDLEDTAFFVEELYDLKRPCQILLSDQSMEVLDKSSLSTGSDGQIYCMVKSGLHRARFSKAAHQHALSLAIDSESIMISGELVKLSVCK